MAVGLIRMATRALMTKQQRRWRCCRQPPPSAECPQRGCLCEMLYTLWLA